MALTAAPARTHVATKTKLNANQIKGFWAAWGGWTLDGMDAFIYALVLVPALTELLPRSGVAVNQGNVGYYGSVLQALFLLGWGLSMAWGPIADRFGRVRALILTILFYSVFTFMCGIVTNIWQLAVLRVLCGIGLGGEQPMGGTFVAEEWPEDRRKMGAGYMHTGYYFGFFLAALANYYIGANYGWRWMFVLGGAPALLVGWIQSGVREPKTWQDKSKRQNRPGMMEAFAALFSPEYKRRTIINSLLFTVSIVGLWAGSIYVPTAVNQIARAQGYAAPDATRMASYGSMMLSVGTIIGCLMAPLARRTPRPAQGDGVLLRRARRRRRDFLRLCVLPAVAVDDVLRADFLPGDWRRELRVVHAVAARAVLDQLPRQRDCLRQLGGALRRGRDGVSRRLRYSVVRKPGSAGRGDGGRLCPRDLPCCPFAEETRGKALPDVESEKLKA